MIRPEEMEIRNLVKKGVPIQRIAELLGRDWKTVAKAARAEHTPQYQQVHPKPSKLDPYKAFLQAKLEEAPYTGPRLLEMIQAQGYTGSKTILYDYVAHFRYEHHCKAVLRFETLPGQQMQADWAEFARVVCPDGLTRKLYLFGAILGYSRMRYTEFTLSQKLETLLDCLIHTFEYVGGVPRELLPDNMKSVMLDRDLRQGTIRWNSKFIDFAGYYSFAPRLTWPYRAQTKGKVERTVGYVRQDFWPGVSFTGLEDLNAQALAWSEKVNSRPHSETKAIPKERLNQEHLTPIVGRPAYDTRVHLVRRVSKDCFISLEGNLYSVPWKHAGREVTILQGTERIELFFSGQKIAEHPRSPGKGVKVLESLNIWRGWRSTAGSKPKELPFGNYRSLSFQRIAWEPGLWWM